MILVFCRSVISFPGLRFTASSKALQLGSAGWPLDSGQKAETTVTRFPDLEAASGGTLLGPLLLPPWCPKGHSLTPRHGLCSLAGEKGGLTMRAFFTIAIVVTMAAVGLGGCFWHHQQAVQTQPLK